MTRRAEGSGLEFRQPKRGWRGKISVGFTLMELLVVIAIISIVAAMLLATLSQARARAYSAKCKSNLHQMGLALKMYVDDAQGQYPYYFFSSGFTPSLKWQDALAPYYPVRWTNNSYHCPGYRGSISYGGVVDDVSGKWEGSYAYNCYGASGLGFGIIGFAGTPSPVGETQLVRPSEMIAITDSAIGLTLAAWLITFPGGTPVFQPPSRVASDCNDYWPGNNSQDAFAHIIQKPPQHGVNFNVLFCDGHVPQMKVVDLMQCSKTAPLWNYDHQPHPEGWRIADWP